MSVSWERGRDTGNDRDTLTGRFEHGTTDSACCHTSHDIVVTTERIYTRVDTVVEKGCSPAVDQYVLNAKAALMLLKHTENTSTVTQETSSPSAPVQDAVDTKLPAIG